MITIGIIADRYVESFDYVIETIRAQSFTEVKLLFSFDQYDAIDVAGIIDHLNAIGFQNRNVNIRYNKDRVGLQENIDWIINNVDTKYYILLKNGDAFYDLNALQYLFDAAEKNVFSSVSGTVVNIKKDGQFVSCKNEVCLIKTNAVIENKGLIDKPIIRRIIDDEQKLVTDSLKAVLENTNSTEMNVSDYRRYCHCVKRAQETLNSEVIRDAIDSILNNAACSIWGITSSRKSLVLRLQKYLDNQTKISKNVPQKIRILFLVMEFSTFPSVQRLYEQALKNKVFEVDLVYVPFSHPNRARTDDEERESYIKHGYNIINGEDYDLNKRCPDVAVMIKSYDSVPPQFYISEISKVIDYVLFIRYAPDNIDFKESEFFIRTAFQSSLNYFAWRNYVNSKKFYIKAQELAWNNGRNFYLDSSLRSEITQKMIKNDYPEEVSKIIKAAKGRRIILWNSNHQILCGDYLGTFDTYGDYILNVIETNPNMFFVWRPHPLFWSSLETVYGLQKIKMIKRKVNNIENILLDLNDSYLPALYIADALLSDMSSIIGEFLLTKKPVCMLYNPLAEHVYPKEYLSSLYIAKENTRKKHFINLIQSKRDPMKNKRLKMLSDYFCIDNNRKPLSRRILRDLERELLE